MNNLYNNIKIKIRLYWQLIKSLQTFLLLFTGVSGFLSARCPVIYWDTFLGLIGSLFLVISGTTVLNMVYDRDIDAKMTRTSLRPLPAGLIGVKEGLFLGLILSALGLLWAFSLSYLFGLVVFAGLFIDVIIYTIWLKRRSAWSIIWGGISGGMPVLAGRVLGIGHVDYLGVLLAVAILCWIPTHILTFNMRYSDDYKAAGIPTIPSKYGIKVTHRIIIISSLGAALAFGLSALLLGLDWGYLRLLAVLTTGIIGLAIISFFRPSDKIYVGLFKFASIFMLSAMIAVALGSYF